MRPEFVPASEPRDALRERLDLPRDRHVVLLMGGGLGIAPLERMLRALDAVSQFRWRRSSSPGGTRASSGA